MHPDAATIPAEALRVLPIVQHVFERDLVAVYLHGSAVAGGLRPGSDVDLLAVIDGPAGQVARASLVAGLMEVSGRPGTDGGPRPVELIVFRRADLAASVYPARCECIYGEWLRAGYEAGEPPGPVADPEFTLLLAQARWEARVLVGPDPAGLLPVVPAPILRRAIGDALPALLASLEGDERNVILTLARMWRTLATGAFVPKDVAAAWAMPRLNAENAALLACAREAYLGLREVDWQGHMDDVRRTSGALRERIVALL